MEVTIDINVLYGILAAVFPITLITARHFWNKEKCFVTMKAAIIELQKHDGDSTNTHSELYEKVDKIERNLYHMMGQMKIKPVD
jgi:hypothetical protein